MNIKYKRSLKIVTLLITSLLIATASAATYNYLFLNAAIGVETLPLVWSAGTDSTVIFTPAGATCSISNLTGPAGGTKNYSDAVRLTATSDVTFDLQLESISGNTSEMDSIFVTVYDTNGDVFKGNLTVWNAGSPGATPVEDLSILTSDIWRLAWQISWKSTATGTENIDVVLKVTTPSP